jgi:hypothetical protein
MYKYSKSTGGFYLPAIHGAAIPEDAVDISEEDHTVLMLAQGEGKVISSDENGYPIAVVPVPATSSKEDRIASLQVAYDSDRSKLNQAWLSAMIADGAEETARKALIVDKMTALDAQLEADILTIIMEE